MNALHSTDTLRQGLASVLNYHEALQRLDGQEDLLGMVAAIFVEDCPRNLDAMREALSKGDSHALAFSAHKLKGALSALGAHPARVLAYRLEQAARSGDLDQSRRAYLALETSVEALIPMLSTLISHADT